MSSWFSQEEINGKRKEIKEAIIKIAEQQNLYKTGLFTQRKLKTVPRITDTKYSEWLNKMTSSEFQFCRAYSGIETMGQVSAEQISSGVKDATARPTVSSASALPDVDHTDNIQSGDEEEEGKKIPTEVDSKAGQPRRSSSATSIPSVLSDVDQTAHEPVEEEKGNPAEMDCEAEQPRRSRRLRKKKFIFDL